MKFIIASDIHGSAVYCEKLIRAAESEGAEKLLLLGDILYHGPRNPLPDGYNPKRVAELLGGIREKIICVRGNCDGEVDQAVLPFPVLSDYAAVYADGLSVYLSHGHRDVPPLCAGDVYATGHTHVPLNVKENGYFHINPGSVSLPKEGSAHAYILYDNRAFYFRTIDGKIYDTLKI